MKQIMTDEKHNNAQLYEWKETISWETSSKSRILKMMENAKNQKYYCGEKDDITGNLNQFFWNREDIWLKFAKEIENKKFLEIGGSIFGASAFWNFIEHRYHIDPLLDKICFHIDKNYEFNWYDDVKKYSQNAEDFIEELDNEIDGCVYMRNCLNHTKNPWKILDNISRYAKPGCHLLMWQEITHPNGGDHGHADICQDPQEMEDFIVNRNFKIIRRVVHGGMLGVAPLWGKDYGCVAIKQ